MFFRPHGNFAQLPNDRRVTFIGRMHRNSAIAQHRLGPGGGDGDVIPRFAQHLIAVIILLDILISRPAREGVFEMPHMARHFDVLDLKIGNRCLEMRVPIHQAFAAVDQAVLVHLHKHLDDRIMEVLWGRLWIARGAAHCEGLA